MHKTLLGTKRKIRFPFFFIKTILLGLCTSAFFIEAVPGKGWLLLFLIVLNVLLLRRDSAKILKFLIITTTALVLVWFLLFFLPGSSSFSAALSDMVHSTRFQHAFLRLWGLFAAGQLYIGTTSQYEILLSLKRIHANVNISLFVVILFNALAYFIRSYKDIRECFQLRIPGKRSIKDNLFILNSLMFDAISTIFECRKAFFLNSGRVYNSLSGQHYSVPASEIEGELYFNYSDVRFGQAANTVIRSAELNISVGITVITGDNGSGKTTLFNLISGVIPNVFVASFADSAAEKHAHLQENIGYVMQGVVSSFFYDTVQRALLHIQNEETEYWLDRFGMVYLYESEYYMSELSAGECKVVMLISELLDKSHNICLLDEPSAFLAEAIKDTLIELIKYAAQTKRILIISHEKSFIDLADNLYSISDGVLHKQERRAMPLKLYGNRQVAGEQFIDMSIPQPLLPEQQKNCDGRYELGLHRSENIAILGSNGAGKTTLGTYLCRSISEGESDLRCVMMRQDLDKQFFTSTVMEDLLLGTDGDEEARAKAKEYLERVGMSALSEQPPQFLSGGQKRMLLIACLLMQNPDIVILDEPFDSLDSQHAQTVLDLICEYQRESGCCCIYIDQTSEMYEGFINVSVTVDKFLVKDEVRL